MNIYLSGMIGSGKTTLGKLLANRLGWAFDDLDPAMEAMVGKDFRTVVAEQGWLGFRQWEYRLCKRFAQMDRTVIALGGGTVRYEWNRDVLRGTGVNVLLTADLDELAARVRGHDRPRVNAGTTLEEDLSRIWGDHKDLYYGFADVVHRTGDRATISRDAEELLEALRREYPSLIA
jgi:shikimate kinase